MRKPTGIPYRRKAEGKTDYKKRMKLLLAGKPRLILRFTNYKIIAQIAEFSLKGDKIRVSLDSTALKAFGWNYSYKNISAAYLTGLMLGKEAVKGGFSEAILDTGLKTPKSKGKTYAFLKGVVDAGLRVPHQENIFPDEKRIKGEHLLEYALQLKKDESKFKQKFGQYLKTNAQLEKIKESFEQVQRKILG